MAIKKTVEKLARVKHVKIEYCSMISKGVLPCVGKTGRYLGVVVHGPGHHEMHGVLFDSQLECGMVRCCFDKRDLELI